MPLNKSTSRHWLGIVTVAVAVSLVALALRQLLRAAPLAAHPLRVLAYSGFINSWGPGPDLAKMFKDQTGLSVEFQDAGDAGLLLQKLELFPADLVLGFDQLTVPFASQARTWRPVANLLMPASASRLADGVADGVADGGADGGADGKVPAGFVPFDWSPLAFVDRENELPPPTSLDDLLDSRFKDMIGLEDPRTTTPGLQFFFWVLDEKGVDEGLKYFEKLKPNVHAVFPSWSAAYGAFTKRQTALVFSYLTSPVYHVMHENDSSFRAEPFAGGQPPQVEYFAIPASCENCAAAEKFAHFLLEPAAQKIIMEKNVMLPVVSEAADGTPFQKLLSAPAPRHWKNLTELLKRRDELFERWRQLGL